MQGTARARSRTQARRHRICALVFRRRSDPYRNGLFPVRASIRCNYLCTIALSLIAPWQATPRCRASEVPTESANALAATIWARNYIMLTIACRIRRRCQMGETGVSRQVESILRQRRPWSLHLTGFPHGPRGRGPSRPRKHTLLSRGRDGGPALHRATLWCTGPAVRGRGGPKDKDHATQTPQR